MQKVMWGLVLFAVALAPCAADSLDRTADMLDDPPSEVTSQTDVSLVLDGDVSDYNTTYFETDLVPKVRTAANIASSIDITVSSFRAGSVIAVLSLSGGDASAVAAAGAQITTQANTLGSALRNAIPSVSGAISAVILPTPSGDSGLSGGAIAGIVIGVIVGITLIALGVWYFCCKDKTDPEQELASDELEGKPSDQASARAGPTDPANPEAAV